MLVKNTSTLPTLKIELLDNPFIKDDIFEVNANFPPRGTPIGIIKKYCVNHNILYVSQSKNNIPWNHYLPERNRTYFCILGIYIKETTTV